MRASHSRVHEFAQKPALAEWVPDLTGSRDIKLNSTPRLQARRRRLVLLISDTAPVRVILAKSARHPTRRVGFVYLPQAQELHLANEPDDGPLDLVELRRQITTLGSQNSDNRLITSRLNRLLVKIAFLSEPKDAAHARRLRSEFARMLQSIEAIASQNPSAKGSGLAKQPSSINARGKGSSLLRYNQLLFQHSNRRHEVVTPGPLVSGED